MSLTVVAIKARKSIRYTILLIIFLTIGRVLFGIGYAAYLKAFPPAPPGPNPVFGKLTKIPFPENGPKDKLNFTLETATGSFPTDIPEQAKVYFMPKVNASLLSLDNAKTIAARMGFNDPNPIKETDTLYKFTNPKVPSVLKMNTVTGAFSISYDLAADRNPILVRPQNAELSATKFKGFLSEATTLPQDYAEGPMLHSYYKLESGGLIKALALSEANLTKVNLFRKPYDKLPSLTADPKQSNVWAILSGSQQREQQIIACEYRYFPVDETKFGTYPLITPETAFNELKNGNGFIASLGQYKEGDSLKIRKIYLAYFDPDVPGDFYQPIYVFDSNDNDPENSFIGYVPAIEQSFYSGN